MNIRHNISLKSYNSFRTESLAALFCEPKTVEELIEILQGCSHHQKLILGGGCNIFFTKNYDGLIIKPAMKGIEVLQDNLDTIRLEVQAGEDWDKLVEYCINHHYAGLENLSLIPGNVGASPFQNIGAYGAEVKDTIEHVNAVDMTTHQLKSFSKEECKFGYRDSIFKQTRNYIITSVVFRLSKHFAYNDRYADVRAELHNNPTPSLAEVREAIIRIRTRKLPDPQILPNAGSFFKNPILTLEEKESLLLILSNAPIFPWGENHFKTSAAYLIDQAGWKGKRIGNVGISEQHALIVVNYGTEKGSDIIQFVQEVQKDVRQKFNVMLEPEVQVE